MKTVGSTNITSLRQPAPADGARWLNDRGRAGEASFRDQLSALQSGGAARSSGLLPQTSPLKFSNHAIDRMQARGIRFSPDEMARIQGAVSKAASKGAKETLLLTDNSALIVSVKDNTVVTVMDKAQLRDNVFTNIDSTVMI